MYNNVIAPISHIRSAMRAIGIGRSDARGREEGPLNYQMRFVNCLPYPITVVDRYGMRHVVQPNAHRTHDKGFSIFVTISISNDGWRDIWRYLASIGDTQYEFARIVKQEWNERVRLNPTYPTSVFSGHTESHQAVSKAFTIEYMIPIEVLKEGNSFFQRDTDFVLSKHDIVNAPPHPFSEDALNFDERIFNTDQDSAANACVQFELITEAGKPMQDRFIALANKVFTIRSKTDTRRRPGLYMTTTERDLDHHDRSRVVRHVFEHSEMETALNIFKTPEEALAGGDLKTVRKEQLAELEHKTSVLKAENDAMRAEMDRAKAERESETREREAILREREHSHKSEILSLNTMLEKAQATNRLTAESLDEIRHRARLSNDALEEERTARQAALKELHASREHSRKADLAEIQMKHEIQSLARKDHYEQRSTARKDTSEVVKFLPAILLGIGTLGAAIYKFFS